METIERSKDYFPIDQSVFDKVLKRRNDHKIPCGTIFHPIDENVFDVVLKRNRQKMSENQKACQKGTKNSNNQRHQEKNNSVTENSDFFPIDQSVFDKVLNRKRSNLTNNGSKIVYAKIDENVFDVVLARKRKMAGKPNENFEPKEVSFDEPKDHTMMSEDLLEGSFFQGNKNILITNVDQHKTSGNDSDQQKTFDSGEVEPKNYDDDDDDDDIESLIETSFIEEPKKNNRKSSAKEYHNDPNFEAMLNSADKDDVDIPLPQYVPIEISVSSSSLKKFVPPTKTQKISLEDLVFDPQSQVNESQEKSVSSDLNFESQHTSKTTSPTAKKICSNLKEKSPTGQNVSPTKTQKMSISPLDLGFDSQSQPIKSQEKSFSSDLNFESQHTSKTTSPKDSSVAPPKNQIHKSRSIAPIVDCPVCKKGSAQHKLYGIVACKACAKCFFSFFPILDTLLCDDDGSEQCDISDHDKHKMCKKCRVLKCVRLGMKLKKGAKK